MAEPTQYTFSYREVVEALLKKQNIHEGQWAIYFEFGMQAANVGPTDEQLVPAAIVPVLKVGVQKIPPGKVLPGVVDAASVNPRVD